MPNTSRRTVFLGAHLGLLCGVLLWIILLIRSAGQVKNMAGYGHHMVNFGPLELTAVVRQPTDQGFIASFSFENGLLWYMLLWLLIGSLGGWILAARRQKAADNLRPDLKG